MDLGYIKLFREISGNKFWSKKPYSEGQAWVDLLLMANYKQGQFIHRGITITVERGQLGRSMVGLGEKWGWSAKKVKRFLGDLKTAEQIAYQTNNATTLITITNYEVYQGNGEESPSKKPSNVRAMSEQMPTNNKDKKNKEVKEVKTIVRFQKPSLEEVSAYCKERGKGIDPQAWIDHYDANGWKVGKNPMKDWKAAIRTWENRRKSDQGVADTQHHTGYGDFEEQLKEAGLFSEPGEGS